MSTAETFRSVWGWLVEVPSYERDPGFRDVINDFTSKGMRVISVLGIGSVFFYVCAHLLFIGTTFTWAFTPTDSLSSDTIWDKLFTTVLCGIIWTLSYRPSASRWGRGIVSVVILFVAVAFLADDVARGSLLNSPVYLILLVLAGAGMLPYRPSQMFALCLAVTVLYYVFVGLYLDLAGPTWMDSTVLRRVIPLIIATIICTGISALLYRTRHDQYLTLQEAEQLREDIMVYYQAENDRQTQELERARQVQLSMLPRSIPAHPKVELAAYMQTATEVGGDYYDFCLSPRGTLTFVIGDATGHGVEAGIMVTAMKSLWTAFSAEEDLVGVVQRSSEALRQMRLPKLYMALAYGRLEDDGLSLVGAGMPPALICRAETGDVEEVPLKGAPLGSPGAYAYHGQSIKLRPGDAVVLMSDGFPELRNGKGDFLGYDQVPAIVRETSGRHPQEIIAHLKDQAAAWCKGTALCDDVTFVVLRMKAVAQDALPSEEWSVESLADVAA